MKIFIALFLASISHADIVSQDANGQIYVQTAKLENLCVDSGATACGAIKAGVGVSNRVGINNTSPATALDVGGTVTATAVAASGAITSATLATTGAITGASAALTGTGGAVVVSTAATAQFTMCLAGTFSTLPTSGYAAGCFAYQLSDNTPYVSTAAVTNAGHWKPLY